MNDEQPMGASHDVLEGDGVMQDAPHEILMVVLLVLDLVIHPPS